MSLQYSLLSGFKDYEKVIEFKDNEVGLKGFIALHNTNLGPALGGTRIYNYKNKNEALEDALRLSKAMTYKCSIAGLPFGGGKAVIIAEPSKGLSKNFLKSYAQMIQELKGEFHTGEDVGLTEEDVQYMLKFCPFFIGKSDLAGDPSPYAGLSAFLCIKEVFKFLNGTPSLNGKTFTVKGVGKTGGALIDFLISEGGSIVAVADTNPRQIKSLLKKHPGLPVVSTNKIMAVPADVFCPCALGNDITKQNLNSLGAKIIVGTANNQLGSKDIAEKLFEKDILHVPDYIANGGGLINVANELLSSKFDRNRVMKSIKKIPGTLREVLEISKKRHKNPDAVADIIAEKIFTKQGSKINLALKTMKAIFQT